jgi:uncharacterized protein (DUF1786 family)
MSLLAVDVGAGTQDIVLYDEENPLEASTKMILPSPTLLVARRIDRARSRGKDIFLSGSTMGGGACTAALRWHLAAGLHVYATPSAAATINDNLERVIDMGIIIQEEPSRSAEIIETGDINIPVLRRAFKLFDLALPREVAVAVQDHGYAPHKSNRLARFEHFAMAIKAGGCIEAFAYNRPPAVMTRMQAVSSYLEEQDLKSIVMDTGPAAIFGAATDPRYADPGLIINFGNGHTVASIMFDGRITALFEHHTSQLTPAKLRHFADMLCEGKLNNTEVFNDGGHGAFIEFVPEDLNSKLVTGPRRNIFLKSGVLENAVPAAPAGDMMITGCVGLLEAWSRKEDLWR